MGQISLRTAEDTVGKAWSIRTCLVFRIRAKALRYETVTLCAMLAYGMSGMKFYVSYFCSREQQGERSGHYPAPVGKDFL
jgi:hypothetical protein